MKKRSLALLLGLVMLFSLVSCGGNNDSAANNGASNDISTADNTGTEDGGDSADTIKIGVLGQITGNNALTGEYTVRGAQLAADLINANGGVLGRQIEIVTGDEGDDQQTAVNALQKILANDDVAGVYGGLTSSYGLAYIPYINEAGVPFMAGGSSAGIMEQKNKYTWQPRLVDIYSASAMAKAAVEVLGMKAPAILYVNEAFGISCYEGMVAEFEKMGITPAIELAYNIGEPQFGNMLTQIIESGADGLLAVTTVPTDAATIMAQTYDMDFPLPCLGSNGFSIYAARGTVKEKSNGWYSVTDYSSSCIHESGIQFEKDYMEHWGTKGDFGAAASYDAVNLLARAIEIAGTTDHEAVNDALYEVEGYDGALSMGMKCNPENKTFSQALVLCINEDDGETCRVVESIPAYE